MGRKVATIVVKGMQERVRGCEGGREGGRWLLVKNAVGGTGTRGRKEEEDKPLAEFQGDCNGAYHRERS